MMLPLLKLIALLVGHIPRFMLLPLGNLLGHVAYRLARRHRATAHKNIEESFKGRVTAEEVKIIATGTFINLALNFLEFMRLPWLKAGDLKGYVDVEGIENLEAAHAKGNGAIICTAHFGNWELLGATLGLLDFPLEVVVRNPDHPVFDSFVEWVRTSSGNRSIHKSKAMLRLMRALKANGTVAILLDQNVTRREGIFIDFLGRSACTNKGPALLAAASSTAVLPTFIIRDGLTHRIVIKKPLHLVDTATASITIVPFFISGIIKVGIEIVTVVTGVVWTESTYT
jgi:KDO2-lipid IV(A) lauroyltransferase